MEQKKNLLESAAQKPRSLNHYTTIQALIGILETGFNAGDPARWEDKNDIASVKAYMKLTGAGSCGVWCFADGKEQIFHWLYYAKKDSGCCIHFKTGKLLALLSEQGKSCWNLLCGFVKYLPRSSLNAAWLRKTDPKDIPFIKRRPYEGEQEYRVIWTGGAGEPLPSLPVQDLIDTVTLAPGMADPLRNAIKTMLERAYPNKFAVNFSRLMENPDWIKMFKNLKYGNL